VAVKVITLSCAGDCAMVEAVGTGGLPPYSFKWDDGTTSATRQVCPTSSTSYDVKVTDTGTVGEVPRPAETAQASVTADLLSCPDGGNDARAPLATVVVPGTTDIWLAGQPPGSFLDNSVSGGPDGDSSPANSPVVVSASEGAMLVFSATGSTSVDDALCYATPDGCGITVTGGPGNGISAVNVPADALVGVFLGPAAPTASTQVPPAIDFTGTGSAFSTLAPQLAQVFFIGDGLTGTGSGAVQTFLVPAGATRLFLASSDTLGSSYNNGGQFSVSVSSL